MEKVEYFRDGLLPFVVVRMVVKDGGAEAQTWDYKKEAWVPDGKAWKTIDDDHSNWGLGREEPKDYIADMLERFPQVKENEMRVEAEGAFRKSKK